MYHPCATDTDTYGWLDDLSNLTLESSDVAGRKETKQKIGNLRLNISEVVRNGKIRDSWALQVRRQSQRSPVVAHM